MDKYKYIFGKPGAGVHSVRLLDVAAVDYVLTLVASVALAWATRTPLVLTTVFMFLLGMGLHWVFGLKTSAVVYLSNL